MLESASNIVLSLDGINTPEILPESELNVYSYWRSAVKISIVLIVLLVFNLITYPGTVVNPI
jgi:hypothetical protein